ncbi:MAG: hypothetical protein IKI31_03695 [Treponema sp.]|nr:hypothetical protein [Treponema sp.]
MIKESLEQTEKLLPYSDFHCNSFSSPFQDDRELSQSDRLSSYQIQIMERLPKRLALPKGFGTQF